MLFWSTFHLRKFGRFKFVIFKFQRLQTSFRNLRLSQIEKFWIPSLFSSSRSTILIYSIFLFEKVWTKCSSNFTSVWQFQKVYMRFKNLWLVFDKTFSNGKMSYVTIVDLAKMIKLGIQSFFIWGHVVSHLSKFDQVKFGQMNFDSSIMNSKWLQIEKFWIPNLFNSLRSTIVVLVNFPFEIVWMVQVYDF